MNAQTRYFPDLQTGLTREQVKTRFREGCINTPVEPPSKSVADIIKGNVFTYFNLVFTIIALLLIIAGSFRDLTFLPIIISNTIIGIVQEIRSKQVLDKLTMLNAPKACVIRDGRETTIPSDQLVLDDLVIFRAGNQIPADAVVVDGQVSVNESLLTGEADEITKEKGDTLMSGSFIVSGRCTAQLENVGEDSYISRLTLSAKKIKAKQNTEMMQSLDKIVLIAGILIIPIGIILFSQQFIFAGDTFRNSITAMVAAVIGMIPEGLYLLASVALVVSVMRLAGQKVLVHDMKCIEMLARVDVLCVDKTGTITENEMAVDDIHVLDKTCTREDCVELITDFAANMDADNSTMKAIKRSFPAQQLNQAAHTVPFSSSYKYSSVSFAEETYILGAPEFILGDRLEEYQETLEEYTARGYRTLIFGSYPENPAGQRLTASIEPLFLITLSNQIREEAYDTFTYFAKQGVAIKVISGDNPQTVSEVASKAGIEHAENFIDARQLTDDEAIYEAIERYTVFGRVTPEQKRKFVNALKKQGHTVAMTGDGVNDVLALKDADCSIAMASGSDAACQASDLVLLDSRFSSMPSVVDEGRRVVNNITRSASLFLVKNIFSLLLAVFSMIFVLEYPLEPSQVSLVSMFTIGVPGFFLAMQPNHARIDGHFITNVLSKALPAGITDAVIVGSLVIFGMVFEVDKSDISTAGTLLLATVGLMILYRISQPLDKIRTVIIIGSACCIVLSLIFLTKWFAITSISLKCGMLLAVFAICTDPLLRYLQALCDLSVRVIRRIRDRKK